MEEFVTEHGNLIISGLISIIILAILAIVIWSIGKLNIVALEQIMGVCI